MKIQSQFNQSNLSIDDWIRLNDIDDTKILELVGIFHKYEDLCRSIEGYEPVEGEVVDDIINALKIRDIDDKDVIQQLENLKSRLDHTVDEYYQIIKNIL